MSSVLDITYKSFLENHTQLSLSRLGMNLSLALGNQKWNVISGFRHRDNALLVDQKETETNFNPSFTDFQTFATYYHSDKLFFNALGAFSINKYRYEPILRQTNFGTIEQPKSLVVYYDGIESDNYNAFTGALKTTWIPNNNNSYRLILSNYQSVEKEHFDILAQYDLESPIHPLVVMTWGKLHSQRAWAHSSPMGETITLLKSSAQSSKESISMASIKSIGELDIKKKI